MHGKDRNRSRMKILNNTRPSSIKETKRGLLKPKILKSKEKGPVVEIPPKVNSVMK